ncbi:type VII secretion protein EccE [Rhodococcus sp. ARC_M6]|uniref:type VII secretion protein EccE n=1 Tax=Rhodococcus sp. ARC_M6 TaxID=2928852 RepID=UPI0027DFB35D|nr:type VII secretion protein EccE [Rhodococcus sp. ARC_M6]MCJ0905082.1 type VII secretion protein EccE [Rhodococcus sp. ARC_M6]
MDRSRLKKWPSSHRISTHEVVFAQACGVGAACVAAFAGLNRWWVLGIACGVAAALLLHVGGWSIITWARTCIRYVRGQSTSDGTIVSFQTPSEQSIGLRIDGSSLVTVVEITPPRDYLTRIGRLSFHASHVLPTAALADCLHQHDISLTGIDIVSHGNRVAAGTPATEVYDRLIGPLPATATRTVWLALRFDGVEGVDAVERRGGGEQGAARSISVATSRVVRVLEATGARARILTAPEVSSATAQVSRGIEIGEVAQTWRSTTLPGVSNFGYGIDPKSITTETLAQVWAMPTMGTSVTVRLRPRQEPGLTTVSATCRFTTRNPPEAAPVAGLISMRGRQRDALITNLPTVIAALDTISPARTMDASMLASLALPLAGCGQLLGSDERGQGVTALVAGTGVTRVFVAGELYVAQQLIFRAIATGTRVLIHTDRPETWASLVDSMGVPDRLRVSGQEHGQGHRHGLEGNFNAVVFDGVQALPPRAGVTAIYVYSDPRQWPDLEPDLMIIQPDALGDRITVHTNKTRVTLTLVTIAAETAFIGRPRSGEDFRVSPSTNQQG